MRRLSFYLALLTIMSCGGASSTNFSPSSTNSLPGSDIISVKLVAQAIRGGGSPFARNTDASECGVRLNGSITGLDTSGKLTLTDRSGKLLGTAEIPVGDLTKLELAPDNSFVSQECTFTIPVVLFERSPDLTLFEFRWDKTNFTIEESLQVSSDEIRFSYGP